MSEIEIVGDGEPIFGRNAHKLGHRSITMLSQKAHFGAQHRFASFAEFTAPADDAWIKRNPTADQRTGIGFFDDARAINAHDLRQAVADAGAAVAHVKVDTVHGRRLHADENFTRSTLRPGSLAHGDDFISTMAGKNGCLHRPHPKCCQPRYARAGHKV